MDGQYGVGNAAADRRSVGVRTLRYYDPDRELPPPPIPPHDYDTMGAHAWPAPERPVHGIFDGELPPTPVENNLLSHEAGEEARGIQDPAAGPRVPAHQWEYRELDDVAFDEHGLYGPNHSLQNPFSDDQAVDGDPKEEYELHNTDSRPKLTREERAQRRRRRRIMKLPYFTWFVSAVQICVFVAELIKMGVLTGNPFQTKPSFNPMLGPSTYVLINMGARFTPCMNVIPGVTGNDTLLYPCANSTTYATDVCSLDQLCGFGMANDVPNQWWRFITAIFLHAGFIHIIVNLILQIRLGGELEQELGHTRYFFIYWMSGIAGFLLSGNFAGQGVASVGASGAVFGIIAIDLLDLLFNWQLYKTPKTNLAIHIAEIIISFVLGLLPGLDNFAHIGGFAMGILTGCALLRSPLKLRLKNVEDRHPRKRFDVIKLDMHNPWKHFQQRSRGWYAWWLVRVSAVVLIIVYFVMLARNFNNGGGHCSWCKYLSCLPVHDWCDQGQLFGGS